MANINTIRASKAPNLPIAPVNYSQQYQDQYGNVLRQYFATIDNFTSFYATAPSGDTKSRPAQQLHTGQMFFDTTLNIPIWWNGTTWVNASGTAV